MRLFTHQTSSQAFKYLIGAFIALAIDTLTMLALLRLGVPLFVARGVALTLGITTTYFFNRRVTFSPEHPASLADWARYASAQSLGAVINFAVSTVAIYSLGRSGWAVPISVCLGAAVGFCYNFFAARRLLQPKDEMPASARNSEK